MGAVFAVIVCLPADAINGAATVLFFGIKNDISFVTKENKCSSVDQFWPVVCLKAPSDHFKKLNMKFDFRAEKQGTTLR